MAGMGGAATAMGMPQRGVGLAPTESAAQLALKKTYRPDMGASLTDAEYAQRQQTAQANANANAAHERQRQLDAQRATQRQQPQSVSSLGSSQQAPAPLTPQQTQQMTFEDRKQQAELQAQAESRRTAAAQPLIDRLLGDAATGGEGAVAGAPPAPGGIGSQESAARSAAFSRAKEQAGQTALASMQALHDVMANSGRMGSSMEAQGEASIIGGAGSDVNDFTRDQMMLDLDRAGEIEDRNFAAAQSKRGQAVSMLPSILGLMGGSGTAY